MLHPFVRETCVRAAERARRTRPEAWAELADDVGEDEGDLADVVRAGGWEAPLRIDAEHLVLAALGGIPLIEVEAEGVPLALVRAAEALTRDAVPAAAGHPPDEDLAGATFLAEAAVRTAGLPIPVPPDRARELVAELLSAGLEPDEVVAVLPHLSLAPGAAEAATRLVGEGY